jgi:hypothetical protein
MALTEPKHRKGSFGDFMDRMLHPGHHEKKELLNQDKGEHEPQLEDGPKKEGDFDNFKDSIKKNEQTEGEDRTYEDLL